MPLHASPHPLAGRVIQVVGPSFEGCRARIVDWYDRTAGNRWYDGYSRGEVVPQHYAMRAASVLLPADDAVVLAVLPILGEVLLHVSELPAGIMPVSGGDYA